MRDRSGSWLLALGLIALCGFLLRLYAINFGLPGLYDPDELMFELGAIRMLSHATLNPGWFGHPATTTMYGLAIVNISVFEVGHLAGWYPTLKSFGEAVYADPGVIILPGRVLMAVFAAGTIWQTGCLARDLFDRRAGLFAASLIAVSPVCVAWSQVVRSDIMGSFFVLLALRAMLKAQKTSRSGTDVAGAGWIGVAIATKWPMGLAALGMLGLEVGQLRAGAATVPTVLLRLARFAFMVVIFTLFVSPYLLLAHDLVVSNLHGEAQLRHLGATGGGPLHNLIWYLAGPLAGGMGWIGGGLAVLGIALAWKQQGRLALWLLMPVVLGMVLTFCLQHLVWEHWALPLLPLLAVFAGSGAVAAVERVKARFGVCVIPVSVLAAAAFLPLLVKDVMEARARMNDTRQRASAWAFEHIPQRATVMIEHFAFDLYPRPWRLMFPLGEAGCVDIKALLRGKIGYNVIENARKGRSNLDYGTMARGRRINCPVDFAILTQFDRYADEKEAFYPEYLAYAHLLSHGRVVATFYPKAGVSSGPVVRIVQFAH